MPFSLDLERVRRGPGDPSSHLGNGVQDFYVETFADSYGDPQPVEASVKRSLGDVRLRYRVNDGNVKQAPTKEAPGGERFNNDPGVVFHRVRGEVKGTEPGDDGRGVVRGRRLVLLALHVHGAQGVGREGPDHGGGELHRRRPFQDPSGAALPERTTRTRSMQIGVAYDVYDVDARGNRCARLPGRARPLRRRHLVHG